MTIVAAVPYTVAEFLRDRVRQTRIAYTAERELRLTQLLPVRSLSVSATAASAFDKAPLTGWWAFLHDAEHVVGLAELVITRNAILFAGINTGSLVHRATDAVKQAEAITVGKDVQAWFLHSSATFSTALILETDGDQTVLPIVGSPKMDFRTMLRDVTARRLQHHSQKRRRSHPRRTRRRD